MAVNGVGPVKRDRKDKKMIDGISGGGGPIRAPIGQRGAPVDTSAADGAPSLRRAAPANDILTTRTGRSALVAELAAAPPVNAARVAELKARIDAGTYNIDPQRIAAAMLALDRSRP